jgi:protein phosphatase
MIVDDAATQAINEDTFALLSHWLELRLKHRRFSVVDSTALKPGARENLTALAKKHQVPVFALALDVPVEECIRRDAARSGRQVGERVIRRHHAQFDNAKREIARDKSFAGFHVLTPDQIANVAIEQGVSAANASRFDVIGDVHGCWTELCDLWEALGYRWDKRGSQATFALPVHPDGRVSVFVGDLADRGPDSVRVLQTVTRLVASGEALFAPGNHDDKLFRMLRGNKVTRSHGLDLTEQQIHALPPHERSALEGDVLTYLASQPPYLVLDGGRLVVAHAGIREDMIGRTDGRVREFCLYGDVRGFEPGTNKPIRHDWAREYSGSALIAYGHTPQAELTWVNNTINLDLGCVFGGHLAALRYPERELVTVPARATYADRL